MFGAKQTSQHVRMFGSFGGGGLIPSPALFLSFETLIEYTFLI